MLDKEYLSEKAGDAMYELLKPIREVFRYFFIRQYRVTYWYDGMTTIRGDRTFNAWHDREARREARKIAGSNVFELELIRRVKLK